MDEVFAAFHARFAPFFHRREVRERSARYLRGLLGPVERKNGWQLAEAVGEADPQGMQRLLYAARAGIESTHAQAVRRSGLRQTRYIGLARTHLQHIATAAALNLIRLGEWWAGTPLGSTRHSHFAALRPAA